MSDSGEGSKGSLADSSISGYCRLWGITDLQLSYRHGVEISNTEMTLRHCRTSAVAKVYLSVSDTDMEMLQKVLKTISKNVLTNFSSHGIVIHVKQTC